MEDADIGTLFHVTYMEKHQKGRREHLVTRMGKSTPVD
jgi:hypothetical protein